MTNSEYHIPVLLNDAVSGLNINPEGIYVDVTYGGGGHSKAILEQLTSGKLIAFDQDLDAKENVIADERLVFIGQNFSYLKNHLKMYGYIPVNGVLADLGVSSHQFDEGERGFSIRYDAKLDMRMNQNAELSAWNVINEYEEDKLKQVLRSFGELNNAARLSRAIVQSREESPLDTINDLRAAIERFAKRGKEHQFLAKVFQAVRIEVNGELDVLKSLLEQCAEVIQPGGRLVVISYHSLEDRLVKNFIKKGKFSGEVEKDFYGNQIRPFKEITRKPIAPDEKELQTNNRARSARLRIAEKL
jgi:16S rRNA (cytosine1402-N4)-methyltransferase